MRNYQRFVVVCSVCLLIGFILSAESASGAVEQTQLLENIQNQILSLRQEFKLRIQKTEEAQEAIAENLQAKVTDLLATQESKQPSQDEIMTKIQQLQTVLETYSVQMNDLEQAVGTMETSMHGTLDSIETQLAQIKKQGGVRRPRPVTAEPTTQENRIPEFAPGQFFRGVYRIFMDGDYETAIAGFQKFLNDFPTSPLAGAAQYWIAESFVRLGEYELALQEYQRLIAAYPSNDKIPDAYYGIGAALLRLGRTEEAQAEFQYVLEHFPNSIAAQKAQNRLKE